MNKELGDKIQQHKDRRRAAQDDVKTTKKQVNQKQKEYQKNLKEDKEFVEETLQLKQMKKKEKKDKEALLKAQRIENETKKNLNDENHILAGTYIKKELEDKQINAEIMSLRNTNQIFEGQEN